MTGADFILASTAGNAALVSFAIYMVVVFVLLRCESIVRACQRGVRIEEAHR